MFLAFDSIEPIAIPAHLSEDLIFSLANRGDNRHGILYV